MNKVAVGLLSFLTVRILDTINMVLFFFQLKLKMAVHAAHTKRTFLKEQLKELISFSGFFKKS